MDSPLENVPRTEAALQAAREPATVPEPVTDSPWFWLMLFSCVSLLALQAMAWKYGPRQAQLERQFQGRQWAAQHGAEVQMTPGESATENQATSTPPAEQTGTPAATERRVPEGQPPAYSTPEKLLISLWPLRILAGVCLAVSVLALWFNQNRKRNWHGTDTTA